MTSDEPVSDKLLQWLITYHAADDGAASRDTVAALRHYQSLRRRDAAIEKVLREDRSRAITVEAHGTGFSATIDDNDYEESIYSYAQSDTFGEALSALAAGLEGESK